MATVRGIIDYLTTALAEGEIQEDWQVAVWVREQNGAKAYDVSTFRPDTDSNEGFIAFGLWLSETETSHQGGDFTRPKA